MEVKQKKCKGITKETKGFGCGIPTYERRYGLGKFCGCYAHWLISTEKGREILDKATLKVSKPRRDYEAFRKQEKERKGLPHLLTNTKNAVHAYVKERDKGKPCISCGTPWSSNFHAGHFYKAELYSSLRFNFLNISSQCQQCNTRLEGNLNAYAINLPLRIGPENFKELERLSVLDKHEKFKWERGVLIEIRKLAQKKLKILGRKLDVQ